MFHGRRQELSYLNNCYQSIGGQLVLVRGRRRAGKTALLLEFTKGKPGLYYACTEGTAHHQLSAFFQDSQAKLPPPRAGLLSVRQPKPFRDWTEALNHLTEFPGKAKKLLIIDHCEYLYKSTPQFLKELKDAWDARLNYENVMIVLCESSDQASEENRKNTNLMLKKCLTGELEVRSFDFYDIPKFFPQYSAKDQLAVYSLLGGTPYYLSRFSPEKSLSENVKDCLLSRDAPLYREPEHRLRRELREIAVYNTILEAVAMGCVKLSQIHAHTKLEKSKLTVYLKNLTELGIIEREFSVHDGLKEQVFMQHGLYRISDPFFRFWYSVVYPNHSLLEEGQVDLVYDRVVASKLRISAEAAFPQTCKEYLIRQNLRGNLPFTFHEIGRFFSKSEELTIMATDQENTSFLLAECYSGDRIVTLPYLNRTITKFKEKKKGSSTFCYCLFSLPGFAAEVRQPAIRQGIQLISGAELFSAF